MTNPTHELSPLDKINLEAAFPEEKHEELRQALTWMHQITGMEMETLIASAERHAEIIRTHQEHLRAKEVAARITPEHLEKVTRYVTYKALTDYRGDNPGKIEKDMREDIEDWAARWKPGSEKSLGTYYTPGSSNEVRFEGLQAEQLEERIRHAKRTREAARPPHLEDVKNALDSPPRTPKGDNNEKKGRGTGKS